MPNTLAPLGHFSKPFLGAATLLAATATFRTSVGVATPAEALNFIHWPRLLTPSSVIPVPCALIGFDESCQFRMPKMNKASGSLILALLLPVNTDYAGNPEDLLFDYANQVGVMLREMITLANTVGPDGNYWNLCGDDSPIECRMPPCISDPKDWNAVLTTTGSAPDPIPETFIEFFASEWLLPWQQ